MRPQAAPPTVADSHCQTLDYRFSNFGVLLKGQSNISLVRVCCRFVIRTAEFLLFSHSAVRRVFSLTPELLKAEGFSGHCKI